VVTGSVVIGMIVSVCTTRPAASAAGNAASPGPLTRLYSSQNRGISALSAITGRMIRARSLSRRPMAALTSRCTHGEATEAGERTTMKIGWARSSRSISSRSTTAQDCQERLCILQFARKAQVRRPGRNLVSLACGVLLRLKDARHPLKPAYRLLSQVSTIMQQQLIGINPWR
jgi:hypothetical protein